MGEDNESSRIVPTCRGQPETPEDGREECPEEGNIFLILLKRGKYLVYLQAQKTNFTVLQKVLSLRTCRGKGERLCTFVYYNRHGEPVAQLIERT